MNTSTVSFFANPRSLLSFLALSAVLWSGLSPQPARAATPLRYIYSTEPGNNTYTLTTAADFEGGVGYIFNGATRLPRAMAIGAAHDPDLAYRAGKLSAEEGRALGVVVDFYPIVDVNNNPRKIGRAHV